MSRRHISQREARAAIKERDALAAERKARYSHYATGSYPGMHIDTIEVKNAEWHIALTARKLGHMILVVPKEDVEKFLIYAVAP